MWHFEHSIDCWARAAHRQKTIDLLHKRLFDGVLYTDGPLPHSTKVLTLYLGHKNIQHTMR